MADRYDPKEIEPRWQAHWEASGQNQKLDLLLLDVEICRVWDGFKVARAARVREEPRCAAKVPGIVALYARAKCGRRRRG